VALIIYHNSQHTRWDEHLSSLASAINSAWHKSTAATPASLFLGMELNHPLGIKWKLFELELDKNAKSMEEFWETALSNMRKARAKIADQYNAGRRREEFHVGNLVLVRLHQLRSKLQQRSAKLDHKWSVPLTITRFVSPVMVLLANSDTGVIIRKEHVSQLKRHFLAE
jgi:hypothetical protein